MSRPGAIDVHAIVIVASTLCAMSLIDVDQFGQFVACVILLAVPFMARS